MSPDKPTNTTGACGKDYCALDGMNPDALCVRCYYRLAVRAHEATERRIVEWLRSDHDGRFDGWNKDLADAIERGEHRG